MSNEVINESNSIDDEPKIEGLGSLGEVPEILYKEHKYNKSSTFLRGMLKLPLDIWNGTNFFNCYISEDRIYLYLVFKKPFDNLTKFNSCLSTIVTSKYYSDYVSTNYFSIIKVMIPFEFLKDVDTFLQGKYSEMSTTYKETILGLFIKYDKTTYDKIKRGLYPSNEDIKALEVKLNEKLPNREVISICDLDNEIFNHTKFGLKEDI